MYYDSNFIKDQDISQNSEVCGFYEMNKSVHQSNIKKEIFNNNSMMDSLINNSNFNSDFSVDIINKLNATDQSDINLDTLRTDTNVSGAQLNIVETKFNPFNELDDYNSADSQKSDSQDSQLLSPSIGPGVNFTKNANFSRATIEKNNSPISNKKTPVLETNTNTYKKFDSNKAYMLMNDAKKSDNDLVVKLLNEYIQKDGTPIKDYIQHNKDESNKIDEFLPSPQVITHTDKHILEFNSPETQENFMVSNSESKQILSINKPKEIYKNTNSSESPVKINLQDSSKKEKVSRTYFDIIKEQRLKYKKENNTNIKKLKINDLIHCEEYREQNPYEKKDQSEQNTAKRNSDKFSQNDEAKEFIENNYKTCQESVRKTTSHSNSFACSKYEANSEYSSKNMKSKNKTKHRKKLSEFSNVPSESHVNKHSQKIIDSNRPKNVKVEDLLQAKAEMRDLKLEQIKKSLEPTYKPKICTKSRNLVSEKNQTKVFDRLYDKSKRTNYNPINTLSTKNSVKNFPIKQFHENIFYKTQTQPNRTNDFFTVEQINVNDSEPKINHDQDIYHTFQPNEINNIKNEEKEYYEEYSPEAMKSELSPKKIDSGNENIDVANQPKGTINNIIDNLNKASNVYKNLIGAGGLSQINNDDFSNNEVVQDQQNIFTRQKKSNEVITTPSHNNEYDFESLKDKQIQNKFQYTSESENYMEYLSNPYVMNTKTSSVMSEEKSKQFYDKSIMWLRKKEAKLEEMRHTKILDEVNECYFTPQIQEYYPEEITPKENSKFKIVFQGNTYDLTSENDLENFFMNSGARKAAQNTLKSSESMNAKDFDKRTNSTTIKNYHEFISTPSKQDSSNRNIQDEPSTNRKSIFQKKINQQNLIYNSIQGGNKNKWRYTGDENDGQEFTMKLQNNELKHKFNQELSDNNKVILNNDYLKSNKSNNNQFSNTRKNLCDNDLSSRNSFFNSQKF